MSYGDATTVAGEVMKLFADAGVETVFGLPGVHNLAFWRDHGADTPRIMGVRHEQTAVFAADGAARATGGLGVALTTTGPGVANTAAAFGEASASGSPVLLLASEIPALKAGASGRKYGVLHQSIDQAAMFRSLAKATFTPREPNEALRAVSAAIRTALEPPRGPVYVDIPTDVLDLTPSPWDSPPIEAIRVAPSPDDVMRAVELIGSSANICFWAGGGVVASGAELALSVLASRLRAPVITTFAARGVISPEHPSFVGLPPHEPEIETLLSSADLVIAVGTDFDGMCTKNWTLRLPERILNINCDPCAVDRNYCPSIAIVADARAALEAITPNVPPRSSAPAPKDKMVTAAWERLRSDPTTSEACRLVSIVGRVAQEFDATVIADMCIAGYWVGGYTNLAVARRLQYPIGWGTLGYALPASVGASASSGRPVLAICGDGGLSFGLAELGVLAQEGLPVTIVVFDDAGYGMLRYDQIAGGDELRGVDLLQPDFSAVASAFGVESVRAGEDLESAVRGCLTAGGPHVVVSHQAFPPPNTTSVRWHKNG